MFDQPFAKWCHHPPLRTFHTQRRRHRGRDRGTRCLHSSLQSNLASLKTRCQPEFVDWPIGPRLPWDVSHIYTLQILDSYRSDTDATNRLLQAIGSSLRHFRLQVPWNVSGECLWPILNGNPFLTSVDYRSFNHRYELTYQLRFSIQFWHQIPPSNPHYKGRPSQSYGAIAMVSTLLIWYRQIQPDRRDHSRSWHSWLREMVRLGRNWQHTCGCWTLYFVLAAPGQNGFVRVVGIWFICYL